MSLMMDTDTRREQIKELLRNSEHPITGTDLAERLGVSRQVIVQDVAVLRAGGQEILASPQGYYLQRHLLGMHRTVVAVQHTPAQTEDELIALVDVGVEVVDVIVEHPIYGEQRGMLHIASREDVRQFIDRLRVTGARLLSELTDGIHLHTLEARRPEQLARARQVLRERGYLVE
jgi:transcriptional regulator of NAD metabolism